MCKKKARDRPRFSWVPPSTGFIKFNVDGASVGNPGPTGIGEVMCHVGKELARFSKLVGIEDSNVAELMAICEAFLIFIDSPFVSNNALIVESDSKNAVTWVNSSLLGPWRVLNFINHIECLKKKLRKWEVIHIFREANQAADQLGTSWLRKGCHVLLIRW
ncbi:hypothetical protein PTKIN_Ptkin16aG0031700 [Pterospermum kingtungense]